MTEIEEAEWHDGLAEWSRESVDGPDQLQVIEVHGEPIGRLRTERSEVMIDGRTVPRITLCGIQLRPPFQRQGIGSAIIRKLKAEAASCRGVLDLGVDHANTNARRLYERLGFVQFGSDEQEVHMRWSPSA
jgi:ribosomal protein S18 acetylase RimI-like enzyme